MIGGAIELLVERKEDVSKRGGGMRPGGAPSHPAHPGPGDGMKPSVSAFEFLSAGTKAHAGSNNAAAVRRIHRWASYR